MKSKIAIFYTSKLKHVKIYKSKMLKKDVTFLLGLKLKHMGDYGQQISMSSNDLSSLQLSIHHWLKEVPKTLLKFA